MKNIKRRLKTIARLAERINTEIQAGKSYSKGNSFETEYEKFIELEKKCYQLIDLI
jgi:hypothetical protein